MLLSASAGTQPGMESWAGAGDNCDCVCVCFWLLLVLCLGSWLTVEAVRPFRERPDLCVTSKCPLLPYGRYRGSTRLPGIGAGQSLCNCYVVHSNSFPTVQQTDPGCGKEETRRSSPSEGIHGCGWRVNGFSADFLVGASGAPGSMDNIALLLHPFTRLVQPEVTYTS